MRIIGLQGNDTSKLPTVIPQFMNVKSSMQRPYRLFTVLVCPSSWVGPLPSKIPNCAPDSAGIPFESSESIKNGSTIFRCRSSLAHLRHSIVFDSAYEKNDVLLLLLGEGGPLGLST